MARENGNTEDATQADPRPSVPVDVRDALAGLSERLRSIRSVADAMLETGELDDMVEGQTRAIVCVACDALGLLDRVFGDIEDATAAATRERVASLSSEIGGASCLEGHPFPAWEARRGSAIPG